VIFCGDRTKFIEPSFSELFEPATLVLLSYWYDLVNAILLLDYDLELRTLTFELEGFDLLLDLLNFDFDYSAFVLSSSITPSSDSASSSSPFSSSTWSKRSSNSRVACWRSSRFALGFYYIVALLCIFSLFLFLIYSKATFWAISASKSYYYNFAATNEILFYSFFITFLSSIF